MQARYDSFDGKLEGRGRKEGRSKGKGGQRVKRELHGFVKAKCGYDRVRESR